MSPCMGASSTGINRLPVISILEECLMDYREVFYDYLNSQSFGSNKAMLEVYASLLRNTSFNCTCYGLGTMI